LPPPPTTWFICAPWPDIWPDRCGACPTFIFFGGSWASGQLCSHPSAEQAERRLEPRKAAIFAHTRGSGAGDDLARHETQPNSAEKTLYQTAGSGLRGVSEEGAAIRTLAGRPGSLGERGGQARRRIGVGRPKP
jgi:hypothetical protein